MIDPYVPSDVLLHHVPLGSTFGGAELELAGAMMVRTLQAGGDSWRTVYWEELETCMRADYASWVTVTRAWMRQPFVRPDFHGLVDKGFAVRHAHGVAFTPDGLERLRRWVRSPRDSKGA